MNLLLFITLSVLNTNNKEKVLYFQPSKSICPLQTSYIKNKSRGSLPYIHKKLKPII